jgi:hypothetical protein
VLHRARAAVRRPVVAERRSLSRDAALERAADASVDGPSLAFVEGARRRVRVEACEPERFVDVDVPEPRDRSLVQECRLHGRLPLGEPLTQEAGGEALSQGLRAVLHREVRLELARLEKEPGSEAPDIPVGDVRSIV